MAKFLLSSRSVEKDDTNVVPTREKEFATMNQWKDQDGSSLLLKSLEYLDVVSLVQKRSVCKQWKQLCTQTIDDKCTQKNKFQSREELCNAVDKYPSTWGCRPIDGEDLASKYGYPINKWDVSNITDFSCIFAGRVLFNEPIGSWDVSNATSMTLMFSGTIFFNQDLSSWDVSNVTDMNHMFFSARSFNQDISAWDVSNVTDMTCMLRAATSFNQDLSLWDVSNVTCMHSMFFFAQSFNQDISAWDVSNVTDMTGMFRDATSFNQDLSSWFNVQHNVVQFNGMFHNSAVDARRLPWYTEEMLNGNIE